MTDSDDLRLNINELAARDRETGSSAVIVRRQIILGGMASSKREIVVALHEGRNVIIGHVIGDEELKALNRDHPLGFVTHHRI